MTLPKVMPSPRKLIHQRFCPAVMGCRFMPGTAPEEAVGVCKQLDELLDFNDEMLLHDKAREFHAEARKPKQKVGIQMGLFVAEGLTDPYVQIDEFTDDPEEFIHPGEERPDCPGCVKGARHFHRKKDNSYVKTPTV